MDCPMCNQKNDTDAAFCANCGRPLEKGPKESPARRRKPYLFALLLLPVLVIAAGIGYYKFFLPAGVAAVVNGEEIPLSELDAVVSRIRTAREAAAGVKAPESETGRIRYAVLSEMITERLALQEARKAGFQASRADVEKAVSEARASSGMDESGFNAYVNSRYGSMRSFEEAMERSICINRFMSGKLTAGISDPAVARARVNTWIQDISAGAAVRIALAEQLPASGCGCCNGGSGPAKPGSPGGPGAAGKPDPAAAKTAENAALKYWNRKFGAAPVETRLTDFGCHIQVDIVKDGKIAQSLRFQNGTITEM